MVGRKQRWPFRQMFPDTVQQSVQILLAPCAETGTTATKSCRLAASSRKGSKALRGLTRSILLTTRTAGTAGVADTGQGEFVRGSPARGLHHQQQQVCTTCRRAGSPVHGLVDQLAAPGMQARRIDKDHLAVPTPSAGRECCDAWSAASGVTMLIFSATSAFTRVDLPVLGRPTTATNPDLATSGILDLLERARRGLLLGLAAAPGLPFHAYFQGFNPAAGGE